MATLITLALLFLESALLALNLHRGIDLRAILRVMVVLMMGVVPALAFAWQENDWYQGYHMPISAAEYWWLVAPGMLLLLGALHWPLPVSRPFASQKPRQNAVMLLLVATGALLIQLLTILPETARQAVYLCSLLWIPALLFAQLGWPRQRWWLFTAAVCLLFAQALYSTLFGEAILWTGILLAFTLQKEDLRPVARLGIAGAAAILILFILSFKYEYRQEIWHGEKGDQRISWFTQLAWQRLTHPSQFIDGAILAHYTDRLNQGYHTALVMAHTPVQEPFAGGESLLQGIKGALLPRFLAPDKHRAGGQANLERFAGIVNQPWSSNIGPFGEAYANFGVRGAWPLLAVYGLFITGAYFLLKKHLPVAWHAYVLIGALSIETDMGMVLNALVKAGLVAVAWHLLLGSRFFERLVFRLSSLGR